MSLYFFFFSSRRRDTRCSRDWSSDVCSSDLPCKLRPGSRVAQVYGALEVSERHRHRYEVSNAYRDVLAEYGMRCSGLSPAGSLVEMIELPDHPWFIGCQFHPELKARPTRPHPLFAGFIGAARQHRHMGARPEVGRRSELAGRHE